MDDSTPISRISTETTEPEKGPSAPTRSATVRELRKPAPDADAPAVRQTPAPDRPAPERIVDAPADAPKRKRRLLRPFLFALLPIALIIAGYMYVTGGQVMSTDNAYVQADTVGVSTDVSGTVDSIDVHENEVVKKGQVLFRLRPGSFQTALAGAQAQLGTVKSQILTLHASYQLALAQINQAQADVPFYAKTLQRQQDLASRGAASKAALDQAQHDLEAAQQKVTVAKAQAAAALAQLNGDANQTVEQNPFYLQAKSAVEDAQRDFNDSIVKAPFDGIVTNVSALQVGSYLKASQPAFNLVSTTHVWVEASPKETELTYVRPGQPVSISVDTYPGVTLKGRVESIDPASASSFSLLPAQNTTGNWVKVVQRIPMRIRLDNPESGPPLRIGMSVTVDVDTGHANGLPTFLARLLGGGKNSHG
jgi:membrane fusion protein (multidrug efflux system)